MVIINGDISDARTLYVFYASETGQAEAIATQIAEAANKEHHFHSKLHDLGKYAVTNLNLVNFAVFVASTAGDGDPPDSCVKFFRLLRRQQPKYLQNLSYALLALGDTNHANFCAFGNNLDAQLEKLGAYRFYATGHADDAIGLELVVEPWRDNLWQALEAELDKMPAENNDACDNHAILSPVALSYALSTPSDPFKSFSLLPIANTAVDQNTLDRSVLNYMLLPEVPVPGTDNVANLSDVNELDLTVPLVSAPYIAVEFYAANKQLSTDDTGPPLFDAHPSQNGPVVAAAIVSSKRLSQIDSVREVWETTFEVMQTVSSAHDDKGKDARTTVTLDFDYEPGDTVAVFAPNLSDEVSELLERLGLTAQADQSYRLSLVSDANTKAFVKKLPTYVPHSDSTLRYVLQHCFDIRACPRKALLRCLAECTEDVAERQQLLKWCSKEFPLDYKRDITDRCLSLFDVLSALPHVRMPINRLFEYVPKLFPRPYSIASSPIRYDAVSGNCSSTTTRFSIAWNLEVLSEIESAPLDVPSESVPCENSNTFSVMLQKRLPKLGIATGHMRKLSLESEENNQNNDSSKRHFVYFYRRFNYGFRLPPPPPPPADLHAHDDDQVQTLIFIATGTGIAPFIGFLQHIHAIRQCAEHATASLSESAGLGMQDDELQNLEADMRKLSLRLKVRFDVWLIYGCREEKRDFLYRVDLEQFRDSGVLSRLDTAFSRDGGASHCYVQDVVRSEASRIAEWIVTRRAHVYLCGDLLKMGKSVNEAMIEVLANSKYENLSTVNEASAYIKQMRQQKRYVEDLWS